MGDAMYIEEIYEKNKEKRKISKQTINWSFITLLSSLEEKYGGYIHKRKGKYSGKVNRQTNE